MHVCLLGAFNSGTELHQVYQSLESLERSLLSCFSIEKPPPLLSSKALLLGIDEQATVPLGEYSSQLQKTVSLILHSL